MVELNKVGQIVRAKEMGRLCAACVEGNPSDPNGPLMGELDCLVEVMMTEELSAAELVEKYGQRLWRMVD